MFNPTVRRGAKKSAITMFGALLVAVMGIATPARTSNAQESASAGDAQKAAQLADTILGAKLRFADGQVTVSHVKRGGVADQSGVRPGDTLQSIEKHQIKTSQDVVKVLSHYQPGHGVVMTVIPKAGPRQIYLAPQPPKAKGPAGRAMLGANLNDADGAVVAGELTMGGPAVIAGVRSGDQLVAIDNQKITSKALLLSVVNAHAPGDRVQLTIKRGGWQRTLTVTLAARDKVASLPKMWIPVPTANDQQQPSPRVDTQDESDQWADEQEAEDIYNVNERALYTDFD